MTDIKILRKYLPEKLIDYAVNFDIDEEFIVWDPELIQLVLESKALDTEEEKQNWFNLLPLMTEEQIAKLKAILVKEKKKIEEIEKKYNEKRRELRKKYLLKWQKLGYLEKVQKIKQEEEETREKEEKDAESLLDDL